MDQLPVLTAPVGTGGAAVDVIAFSAGHERSLLGPHVHGDLELMLYAEGGGTDRLGATAFEVQAGDLVLVTPGIVHDASGLGDSRGWAVEFAAEAASRSGAGAGTWWVNPLLSPFIAAGATWLNRALESGKFRPQVSTTASAASRGAVGARSGMVADSAGRSRHGRT